MENYQNSGEMGQPTKSLSYEEFSGLSVDDQIVALRNLPEDQQTNYLRSMSQAGLDKIAARLGSATQADSEEATARVDVSHHSQDSNEQEGRNISRRKFVEGAAASIGAAAIGRKIMDSLRGTGVKNALNPTEKVNPDELGVAEPNHEQEKFTNLREIFSYIERERFDEDPGRILNDPDTVGGHAKAYDAGEAEGNERTMHWVAYKNDLLDNPEFGDLYAGENYAGLETADDYGAFYEHVAYSTRPVAAADLIALRHPDFAGLSLEQAENRLSETDDVESEAYKNWLQSHYEQGGTEYKFVGIPEREFRNLGIVDRGAEHGMFTVCDVSELLRDDKNHLVEATTTLKDGTRVTRYINPVCSNILNEFSINGKAYIISENEPITPKPGEPDNPGEPDKPDELEPKNAENMTRIDENAHSEIADNVNTGEINVEQTSADNQPVTSQPSSNSYEGTSPSIEQSVPSQSAESVSYSSSENNYSQDLGRANPLPDYAVQPDTTTPVLEEAPAPTTPSEAADALSDLGID